MTTTRTPKTTKPKAKTSAKPAVTKRKRGKPAVEIDPDKTARPANATEPATKPKSGLDAAALVLRESDEPLDSKSLVTRMLECGLWTTTGKTPAATIYSAMIREITAKGSASRFRKVDAGRFTAAG